MASMKGARDFLANRRGTEIFHAFLDEDQAGAAQAEAVAVEIAPDGAAAGVEW